MLTSKKEKWRVNSHVFLKKGLELFHIVLIFKTNLMKRPKCDLVPSLPVRPKITGLY